MKILAITCIILCIVVIAYVGKIYLESRKYKLPSEEEEGFRF